MSHERRASLAARFNTSSSDNNAPRIHDATRYSTSRATSSTGPSSSLNDSTRCSMIYTFLVRNSSRQHQRSRRHTHHIDRFKATLILEVAHVLLVDNARAEEFEAVGLLSIDLELVRMQHRQDVFPSELGIVLASNLSTQKQKKEKKQKKCDKTITIPREKGKYVNKPPQGS